MTQAGQVMLRTVDVRVDYENVTAVRDLNLEVRGGEVLGLIGPNGAGKTSTLRVLATLLTPTYGDVYIGGIDAAEDPAAVRRIIGYAEDLPPVYDDLRVWEFLDLFAAAYGLSRGQRRQRVEESLELAELREKRDAMAGTLSRGMKQRLILAKAMLHHPAVLLLDEPATGLDPVARIKLRQTLRRLADGGCTIIVSAHILAELSDMCSSMVIMELGRVVLSGDVAAISRQMTVHRQLVIRTYGAAASPEAILREHRLVVGLRAVETSDGEATNTYHVDFAGDEAETVEYLAFLVGRGLPIKDFSERRLDMEEILMRVGARRVS